MKFLQQILERGEHPITRTHLHVIYLFSGLWWFGVMAGIGWAADFALWYYFGAYIPQAEIVSFVPLSIEPGILGIIMTLGGALIFAMQFVKYLSTDIVVTSKRLLYKTGMIQIKLDATDISDILGAHVDQGWFGQFFGYGKLILDCRFIKDVNIPYVKNPYGIVHTIQRARSEHAHASQPPPSVPVEKAPQVTAPQTLIQIGGTGPVYIVDKVPDDPRTELKLLPKSLGDNMLSAFRRKA